MKKNLLSLFIIISLTGKSQAPPHFLNMVRNASNLYFPQSVCRLSNGNNVIAVEIVAGMAVSGDGGFITTNSSGNISWYKTFQGYYPVHVEENNGSLYSTLSTTHGGGGFIKSNINTGNIVWAKDLDNANPLFSGGVYTFNILKENTGNAIFYWRYDNNSTNYTLLTKVDASGNSTFSKRLDSIYPLSVMKVNSDYLLLGKKDWHPNDSAYYLMRLDVNLNTVWSTKIMFPQNTYLTLSGVQNNAIYVGGSTNTTQDAVLAKFDVNGTFKWARTYYATDPYILGTGVGSVVYKSNHLYILGSANDSVYKNYNSVIKLDTNGTFIRNRVTIYNSQMNLVDFAINNADTSLYSIGNIDANPGFNPEMYQMQFDLNGDLEACIADSIPIQDSAFVPALSPAPAFVAVNEPATISALTIPSITEVPFIQSIRTKIDSIVPTTPDCSNPCGGDETVYISGLDQNPAMNWSANASGQTGSYISGLCAGTYSLTLTDEWGCMDTASAVLGYTTPPTPDICMVTVDTMSTHNIIYWDKTNFIGTGIDSFKIYREDFTGIYGYIGAIAFDSLSEYHDYAANPNVTTKRYKISVIDTCGIESNLSPYHNTIYITYSGSGQYNWNPQYTIEASPNPVTQYLLMRDDNSTGAWNQVASTAGTQFLINDPAFASYPNGSWRVETSWSISCVPTRGAINTSRSNIKVNSVGIKPGTTASQFSIFPNPASNYITVETATLQNKTVVELVDVLGQVIYSQQLLKSRIILDVSGFAKGVYFIRMINGGSTGTKKVIIE